MPQNYTREYDGSTVEGLVFENSSWIEGGEIITPQLPEQTLRTNIIAIKLSEK